MDARYQILREGGVWDFKTRSIVRRSDEAAWAQYQGWLTAGHQPLPPDSIGQSDLATAKADRIADIEAYAAGLRNKGIAGISVGEMSSWAMKVFDALAVKAGQSSPFAALLPALGVALGMPTPASINAALGAVRGITEDEYADKVIAAAGRFLVGEIAVDAIRGKHCDAINAMTDVRDIVVYDWMAGWPSV